MRWLGAIYTSFMCYELSSLTRPFRNRSIICPSWKKELLILFMYDLRIRRLPDKAQYLLWHSFGEPSGSGLSKTAVIARWISPHWYYLYSQTIHLCDIRARGTHRTVSAVEGGSPNQWSKEILWFFRRQPDLDPPVRQFYMTIDICLASWVHYLVVLSGKCHRILMKIVMDIQR